jgi:hypothetical protein
MLRVTVRSLCGWGALRGEVHESAEGASWEWGRARACRAARGQGGSAPDHEGAEGGREWRARACATV